MGDRPDVPIRVVGLIGGESFGRGARAAIEGSDVVVGSHRQLELSRPPCSAERVELTADLHETFDVVEARLACGASVTVLASGDPGFFGIVRSLATRFGSAALEVHPAPSSIALAFALVGCPWDDAVVVSAHGRSLDDAVATLTGVRKAAVLPSPDNPPQAIGSALLARGCPPRRVAVVTRLGEDDEAVVEGDLDMLASGELDPMSVVLLFEPAAKTGSKVVSWGLSEDRFAHRAGMITKAEVRAIVLSKLQLPSHGVMWDIGAGSGSVGIEALRIAPELRVVAVERDDDSVARIVANAAEHDVRIDVVGGEAPAALAELPDPDRVFVGGGGIDVLDVSLERLRPGGVVVANYALLDRAVAGRKRLGNLVEVSVARGVGVGEHGVRLAAENPVYVCWGPS